MEILKIQRIKDIKQNIDIMPLLWYFYNEMPRIKKEKQQTKTKNKEESISKTNINKNGKKLRNFYM